MLAQILLQLGFLPKKFFDLAEQYAQIRYDC